MSIGTKKFSSMLRDLGFVEGDNITSQRYDNHPTPCLIFSPIILENLNLSSPAKIELKEVIEDFEQ